MNDKERINKAIDQAIAEGRDGYLAGIDEKRKIAEEEEEEEKMLPEQINDRYKAKIIALLNVIKGEIEVSSDGKLNVSDVEDTSDECFSYELFIGKHVRLCITIAESEPYSGDKGGMSFILEATDDQGSILVSHAPHNYTNDCWVPRDDEGAIEARWEEFYDTVSGGVGWIAEKIVRAGG